MLNTLDDYVWRSLPQWGELETNPNLGKKVDERGRFLPFYGNTVVFPLDHGTKEVLAREQERLHRLAGEILAEPLKPETFHMTLHDLANGPVFDRGLEEWMAWTEPRAREILERLREQGPIRMEGTWLFNMVSTSVVLGLRPGDEEGWDRLDGMYQALETVVPLGYALTPHITMAYFKPGRYSQEVLEGLRQALRPVEIALELRPWALEVQNFRDMNRYSTLPLAQWEA